MGAELNFGRTIVNKSGRIQPGSDDPICVTFSFYQTAQSADGLCRVSDGSKILRELFEGGKPVRLTSPELNAVIRFSSSYTFDVIGFEPA
jgi:hypothetical protein